MGHYGIATTILLIMLAIVLGVLVVTGVISVDPAVEQSILLVLVAAGGVLIAATAAIALSTSRPARQDRFNNQIATVIADLAPSGRVQVHGEDWAATLPANFAGSRVAAGTPVRVVGMADLHLIVVPLTSSSGQMPAL